MLSYLGCPVFRSQCILTKFYFLFVQAGYGIISSTLHSHDQELVAQNQQQQLVGQNQQHLDHNDKPAETRSKKNEPVKTSYSKPAETSLNSKEPVKTVSCIKQARSNDPDKTSHVKPNKSSLNTTSVPVKIEMKPGQIGTNQLKPAQTRMNQLKPAQKRGRYSANKGNCF